MAWRAERTGQAPRDHQQGVCRGEAWDGRGRQPLESDVESLPDTEQVGTVGKPSGGECPEIAGG